MKCLCLTPLDVFTVRDARPFDVGGIVHARGIWPPPPWTVMGALRAAMAEVLGLAAVDFGHVSGGDGRWTEVVARLGPPDGAARFHVGPALLFDPGGVRWPAPADVLAYRDREGNKGRLRLRRLRSLEGKGFPPRTWCNVLEKRDVVLLPPEDETAHPEKHFPFPFFDDELLRRWLEGEDAIDVDERKKETLEEREADDLARETRIGIQLDLPAHTVREGRFYVREVVSLGPGRTMLVPLVEESGLPWEELRGQHVRFGADGHVVEIGLFEGPALLTEKKAGGSRARLLLLSPLQVGDVGSLVGEGLHVHAVASGRPVRIGGWMLCHDGSRQFGPRPLRAYYPAGTVLYVEGENLERFHARSIAQDPAERAAGFGFCLVGNW